MATFVDPLISLQPTSATTLLDTPFRHVELQSCDIKILLIYYQTRSPGCQTVLVETSAAFVSTEDSMFGLDVEEEL